MPLTISLDCNLGRHRAAPAKFEDLTQCSHTLRHVQRKIGEASKDARVRADQIAMHTGCRVTGVRNARMGVLQITRPFSTEVSDSGMNDTSSIEKDVMSVVTLTLGVENGVNTP